GRLFGILNGCDYDNTAMRRPSHRQFVLSAMEALDSWAEQPRQESLTLFRALQRLHAWQAVRRKPGMVIGSVGRLSDQKISLLRQPMPDGRPALDHMLGAFDQGVMILLGSGAVEHERFFLEMMARHEHFLFLNGFSEGLAEQLYSYCDLFLMPSTFEPCGISQMLAMRAGNPCLVHAVGGLADTVTHLENGFVFAGAGPSAQAQAMLEGLALAWQIYADDGPRWKGLRHNAGRMRFDWDRVVQAYEQDLYPAR
ncbi:MAG TPA: glycogen synthase, partial [Pseudomonadaceae bacterium]|nr:glycogen synthase [Pseudomonadaceae bacterium]